LAKRDYVNCKAYNRTLHKRELTEKLLVEMKELCDSYQVPFLMAYLNGNEESKDHYRKFTEDNQTTMIDCYFSLTAERRVRGDGHPNEIHHTSWADCISNDISGQINQIKSNK